MPSVCITNVQLGCVTPRPRNAASLSTRVLRPEPKQWRSEVIVVRVIFITGFNRSGTTLVTTAVTEAARATTLTVGDLARHLPSIDRFLTAARKRATVPDRGVDRLPVNESTPEEYGWLLHAATGEYTFGATAADSGTLRTLVDELANDSDAPVVVLKNPWDTGHEQLLLDHFPDSGALLVRRRLSAIETVRSGRGRGWSRPTDTCARRSATASALPNSSG